MKAVLGRGEMKWGWLEEREWVRREKGVVGSGGGVSLRCCSGGSLGFLEGLHGLPSTG